MPDTAELIAAFDPESGVFVDLVRSDPGGLFFRADGAWQAYQPAYQALDGVEVIDVDEGFVAVFDQSEAARGTITRETALKYAADDGTEAGVG